MLARQTKVPLMPIEVHGLRWMLTCAKDRFLYNSRFMNFESSNECWLATIRSPATFFSAGTDWLAKTFNEVVS